MSSNNADLDKPFALLTSLRYDPELADLENAPRGLSPVAVSFASHIWLSRHHVDRLRSAAHAHAWTQAAQFGAGDFVKACQLAIDSLTRQGDPCICKVGYCALVCHVGDHDARADPHSSGQEWVF
jgi:hypothetical protein